MKSKKVVVMVVMGMLAAIPLMAPPFISYLQGLHSVTGGISTVPANGDINPYGIFMVPKTIGKLVRGNMLVSNFNNSANLQGTGTTIVQISPTGQRSLFVQLNPASYAINPQRIGLTTALVVLSNGWVIVGSLPTLDGTSATATDGNIFILNSTGKVVKILNGSMIHGPWDADVLENGSRASLFVTNVMDGTVVRIVLSAPKDTGTNAPVELSRTIIGSGFTHRADPAALFIGPTGLAVDFLRIKIQAIANVDLYVADTLNNRIMVIHSADTRTSSAGIGDLVYQGGALNQPLGLVITPFGTLLAANAADGNIVEVSRFHQQLGHFTINANGAGTLFGLLTRPFGIPAGLQDGFSFSTARGVWLVDDGSNTLRLLH